MYTVYTWITGLSIFLGKNQNGMDAKTSQREPMINPIHQAPTQRGSPGLISTASLMPMTGKQGDDTKEIRGCYQLL